jgi:hypothetical protein
LPLVAAELLEDELGEGDEDHRLGDDAGRRDDADVAALVVGLLDRPAGDEIGRGQRPGEGGDRLHRAADDDGLPVRDAARQAAGVVRAMDPAARRISPGDDVVDLRTEAAGLFEAEPELDPLDDVDAHDGRGQGGIEPPIPVDVAAEADGDALGDDLEDAAHGVAAAPGLVDPRDHPGFGVGIGAAERARLDLLPGAAAVGPIDGDPADLGRVRPDGDAEGTEEGPGDGPGGDAGGRLARRGSLEDVPDVREAVLEGAGQVGVAGSDPGHRGRPLVPGGDEGEELLRVGVGERLDLHDPRPVLPVAVPDEEEDRRTQGPAVADPRDDLGPVLLDLLAGAATVAALPAAQVEGDGLGGKGQPGREALDGHPEEGAVGLAGGQEAKGRHRRLGA